MTPDAILKRQRLIMTVGVVVSLILPVVAWAMVPMGGVDLSHARAVLSTAIADHGLEVIGIEEGPHRALPVWVDWHPVRLMQQRQPDTDLRLNTASERYRLRGPGTVNFDCELHQRQGEVLWIRLHGTPEAAELIGPLRTDLRRALPWLPVSSPWQ